MIESNVICEWMHTQDFHDRWDYLNVIYGAQDAQLRRLQDSESLWTKEKLGRNVCHDNLRKCILDLENAIKTWDAIDDIKKNAFGNGL